MTRMTQKEMMCLCEGNDIDTSLEKLDNALSCTVSTESYDKTLTGRQQYCGRAAITHAGISVTHHTGNDELDRAMSNESWSRAMHELWCGFENYEYTKGYDYSRTLTLNEIIYFGAVVKALRIIRGS